MDLVLVMKERFRDQSSEIRFMYRTVMAVTFCAAVVAGAILYSLNAASRTSAPSPSAPPATAGSTSPSFFTSRALVCCLLFALNILMVVGLVVIARALQPSLSSPVRTSPGSGGAWMLSWAYGVSALMVVGAVWFDANTTVSATLLVIQFALYASRVSTLRTALQKVDLAPKIAGFF